MSVIDRLFVGRVIRDLGILERRSFTVGRFTKRLLLAEQRGVPQFVIKTSGWSLFSFGVRYRTLSLETAYKLRECIDESDQIARGEAPRGDGWKERFGEQVIRDFGHIERQASLGSRQSRRVVLIERQGKLFLEMRSSSWFLLAGSWDRDVLALEDALQLREWIDEGEQIVRDLPPTAYDPRKAVLRNCSLIVLIGGALEILARSGNLVAWIAVSMLILCLAQCQISRQYADERAYVNRVVALAVLFTITVTAIRVALLVR